MARIDETWDQILDAFTPGEVLVGERSDELYCDREHSPFDRMRIHFRLSGAPRPGRPPITFFTGHRGSGKSSMLVRLLEHFKDGCFVVYFDINHNLDNSKANQIDLLYLLGATVFKVGQDEGLKPDPKHLVGLSKSIDTLVTTSTGAKDESIDVVELASNLICFGASALGGSMAETLTKTFLNPFKLSAKVNDEVVRKRESEPKVQEVINNVNLILADVELKAKKPLLIVVDGLDKLQRTDQARLIFLESRALYGPMCQLIYTVPMSIFTDLSFSQAEEESKSFLMPNVKLYYKESGRKYGQGYGTMKEVTGKRLASIGLKTTDLFVPRALDYLIKKSGGVMRWFIELVQDACTEARLAGRPETSSKVCSSSPTAIAIRGSTPIP